MMKKKCRAHEWWRISQKKKAGGGVGKTRPKSRIIAAASLRESRKAAEGRRELWRGRRNLPKQLRRALITILNKI